MAVAEYFKLIIFNFQKSELSKSIQLPPYHLQLNNANLRRDWNCCRCVCWNCLTAPPETPTASITGFFLWQVLWNESWETGLHQITYNVINTADYLVLVMLSACTHTQFKLAQHWLANGQDQLLINQSIIRRHRHISLQPAKLQTSHFKHSFTEAIPPKMWFQLAVCIRRHWMLQATSKNLGF